MTRQLTSSAGRAALLAFLAVAGCTRHDVSERTVRHAGPGGLTLTLPAAYDGQPLIVETWPAGLQVVPAREQNIRFPHMVDVRIVREAPPPELEVRIVGARTIHHGVATDNCGSCGTAKELTAWEACGDAFIQYSQTECSNCSYGWGGPDFTLAWIVIAGTDPRAACGAPAPAR